MFGQRFSAGWMRIRSLLFRHGVPREVEEELAFHLDMRTRDGLSEGLEPTTARQRAEERFGDVDMVRAQLTRLGEERVVTERRSMMFDNIRQDLKYALRSMARRPSFGIVVVLTLALGVGANSTIFSVVRGVLVKPLDYEQPDDLVLVWGREVGLRTGSSWNSYPDYVDFEDQNQSFSEMAGASFARATITGRDAEPLDVTAARMTHDFLPLLGVTPALGRGILPEEDQVGAPPVVMISHSLWNDRYGGDTAVVGSGITVDGVVHTLVGVLPQGFRFNGQYHVWRPAIPIHAGDSRGQHRMWALARLQEDVTLEEANADLELLAGRLEEQYPQHNTNRTAWVQPLKERFVGNIRPTLVLLFAAVGLVLVMACANIANLQLARATVLYRELAVRSALGAGRGRILTQLITESVVLCSLGGMLGIALAFIGVNAIVANNIGGIPRLESVGVDGVVLAFALVATGLAGLLFGLIPALLVSRPDLQTVLKESGRSPSGARLGLRLRQSLVVAEVALALVVVLGAGLVVNSLNRLMRVETGFSGENVLVVPLAMPGSNFNRHEVKAFYDRTLDNVSAIPGVQAVAAGYQHPLAGGWETSFTIPGVIELPAGERPEARILPVTPGYFETLGIELIEGRTFDNRDDADAPGVAIINASFAQAFFEGSSPVGHRINRGQWWPDLPGEFEIVGVVADVKMDGLGSPTPWAMYYPHEQQPFDDMIVLARTSVDPLTLATQVREAVWAVDPNVPLSNVSTLDQIQSESVATQRLRAALLGGFGILALVLAAIGIYGVLAYTVALRTPEFGVRISLGARPSDVMRDVVGRGLGLTGIGLVVGGIVAYLTAGLVSGLLFGVTTTDVPTILTVVSLLVVVAVVAAVVPALRASHVDPVRALRAD